MGKNGGIPDLRRLSTEVIKHIEQDDEARKLKKKYNAGVAKGLCAIFLSLGAFIFMMFYMLSHLALLYIALFVASTGLMVAALIIVPIRLKRLQSLYLGGAGDAAGEYIAGGVGMSREEQRKDP
jgi:hypothetical protein